MVVDGSFLVIDVLIFDLYWDFLIFIEDDFLVNVDFLVYCFVNYIDMDYIVGVVYDYLF